jgi:hypothetical protein
MARSPDIANRHRASRSSGPPRIEAVVFDLLYTLVHPGLFPGGTHRIDWLAGMLGVDSAALGTRWATFEPVLEAGRVPGHTDVLGPELAWVRAAAGELGAAVTGGDLDRIEADWDLTRREALLDPPSSSITALTALRERGVRLSVLSNTHALELRAWARSPLPRWSMSLLFRMRSASANQTVRRISVCWTGSASRLVPPPTSETAAMRSWPALGRPALAWSYWLRRPQPRWHRMTFPDSGPKRMRRLRR